VIDTTGIRQRYEAVAPHLDERGLRLFAASEARAAGRGGIAAVSQATGIARSTIGRGLRDLAASAWPSGRVRRSGGGRKAAVVEQPGLLEALTELISSAIRGDPQAALLWVSRSQRHLAGQLAERGYRVDHTVVGRLLKDMGFSLQANAKTREGSQHPDRNAQFEHINARVARFRRTGQPAISVDTKKKELIGDFRNVGRELRPKGQPRRSACARLHDCGQRQGRSVRRLRYRRQRGMGQRRPRSRHCRLRRRKHPPLVASHGPQASSPRQAAAHHRRLRLP
jgi:hypothetical protein